MTNGAATVRNRFSSAKPDRFLTGATLKEASDARFVGPGRSNTVFTGIIESVGVIRGNQASPGGRRLQVGGCAFADELAPGASVAVSGVCLTVTAAAGDCLEFDVVSETLESSTLASRKIGDRVNLERALRVGDRLDGHFVQGHVDGTAVVERVQTSGRGSLLWLRPDAAVLPYVVSKGSIAVDGVSLTIAETRAASLAIALIPTTLEQTTLSSLSIGDPVNIETDMIVRTVVRQLSGDLASGGLTLGALREAGFA